MIGAVYVCAWEMTAPFLLAAQSDPKVKEHIEE
jgi:hypothetical protein